MNLIWTAVTLSISEASDGRVTQKTLTTKQDLFVFTITDVKTYYTIVIHLHIGLLSYFQSLIHANDLHNVLFECEWHLHDVSDLNLDPGVTYVCFSRRCNTVSRRVAAALFSLEGKAWSPQESQLNSTLDHKWYPPKQHNRELSGNEWVFRLAMSTHRRSTKPVHPLPSNRRTYWKKIVQP